jgi:hypothetical protein
VRVRIDHGGEIRQPTRLFSRWIDRWRDAIVRGYPPVKKNI